MKLFGPDDNDGLSLLSSSVSIQFVTGDHGFATEKEFVDDMNYPLELVSTIRRIDWIRQRFNPEDVIYMGDGIFDHYVMKKVAYSIAPANGDKLAKEYADYVTERRWRKRSCCKPVYI